MAERLFIMHRILKETGSIYLHCDPYASHYLKLIMDAIFGEKNYRNEIIWHYRRWTAGNKNFQRMHDVLFRYTKSDDFKFNVQYEPYGDWIKKDYSYTDDDGRRWRWHTVKGKRYKVYLEDENRGDDGIDGFGVFFSTPDNLDRKAIIVQVTGASGSQKAKFDRLHANIRNENAAMGILITLDAQTAQHNWKHTLDSIRMGETTYAPIQCFSIEEYYRNNERWDRILTLPPLANPWTGKHMQQKILFDA